VSQDLINALQNPSLYPHSVDGFKLMETHISWVILTGNYVYKLKKPMDFGFLNFSTLDKRKFFCEQELQLNRRLADEIYLDLLAVTGSAESPRLVSAHELTDKDSPIEYVIKMTQFPQEGLFDQLQKQGELHPKHIETLAHSMANFHLNKANADTTSPLGTPEAVYAPVKQNFEQITPLLEEKEQLDQLKQLAGWAESTWQRLTPLLAKRKAEGFIRECHGDAHLGNITLFNGKPVLFDCIEFNDEFRWIDVISDIAFLIMDLEDRGEDKLARLFLNTYLEDTGDYEGLRLLDFYKAYRAMVRAKIALFTLGAPNLDKAAKAGLKAQYQKYADLAESYSVIPLRFALMMHGLSGTGKTTVSHQLVNYLPTIRVRSDVERKRLHGLQALDKSHSGLNQGLYSAEMTKKTYQHLVDVAGHILGSGRSVLIDGTHLHKWQREILQNVVDERGVPLLIVSCQIDEKTAKKWIETRQVSGLDASEAGTEVYDQQKEHQDELDEEERKHCILVKADDPQVLAELPSKIQSRLGIKTTR
jgi:aminoglycoside phosphotransferase family enzyme/predicted kinase